VWASLVEYVPAVFRQVWALAVGIVLTIIGAIALTVNLHLPWWADVLIGFVCITPAQFLAFHQVRLARDAVQSSSPPTTVNTTWAVENLNVQIVLPPGPDQPQIGP
jgi:hypothetical protein